MVNTKVGRYDVWLALATYPSFTALFGTSKLKMTVGKSLKTIRFSSEKTKQIFDYFFKKKVKSHNLYFSNNFSCLGWVITQRKKFVLHSSEKKFVLHNSEKK